MLTTGPSRHIVGLRAKRRGVPVADVDAVVRDRARDAVLALCRHTKVVAAYMFGSHVEGTPRTHSDIDIAVFVEGPEDWDIFHRAEVNAAVHQEAGDDVELHYFRASALSHPAPAGFVAYVIHHGVAVPVDGS